MGQSNVDWITNPNSKSNPFKGDIPGNGTAASDTTSVGVWLEEGGKSSRQEQARLHGKGNENATWDISYQPDPNNKFQNPYFVVQFNKNAEDPIVLRVQIQIGTKDAKKPSKTQDKDHGRGDSISTPPPLENGKAGTQFNNGGTISGTGSFASDTMNVMVNLLYEDRTGNSANTPGVQAQLDNTNGSWTVTLPPAPINDWRYIFCVRFMKMNGMAIWDRFIDVGAPTN